MKLRTTTFALITTAIGFAALASATVQLGAVQATGVLRAYRNAVFTCAAVNKSPMPAEAYLVLKDVDGLHVDSVSCTGDNAVMPTETCELRWVVEYDQNVQELYCTIHSEPGVPWASNLRIDPYIGASKQGLTTASSVAQRGIPEFENDCVESCTD